MRHLPIAAYEAGQCVSSSGNGGKHLAHVFLVLFVAFQSFHLLAQELGQGDDGGDGVHDFVGQHPYQLLPGQRLLGIECRMDVL